MEAFKKLLIKHLPKEKEAIQKDPSAYAEKIYVMLLKQFISKAIDEELESSGPAVQLLLDLEDVTDEIVFREPVVLSKEEYMNVCVKVHCLSNNFPQEPNRIKEAIPSDVLDAYYTMVRQGNLLSEEECGEIYAKIMRETHKMAKELSSKE